MRRLALTGVLLVVIGCGSNAGQAGHDGGAGAGGGGGGGGSVDGGTLTAGGTLQCTTYGSVSSIAALRNPTSASHVVGCYTLTNVLVVGRTSSPNKPRVFVEDAGGGDYSALMAKCGPTDVHACLTLNAVMQATPGEVVTVQGHYVFSKTNGFEEFAIEQLTTTGATGTLPAPAPVALVDITRGAQLTKTWFQKVTTTVAAGSPLVMYDFSPADLKTTSGTCPFYNGFAMIPSASAPGGFAPVGCSGTTNPPAQPVIGGEIVINRFFYSDFNWHTDCACQPAGSVKILLNPTATVAAGTPISGILSFEIDIANPTSGHQEFLPMNMNDLPITN